VLILRPFVGVLALAFALRLFLVIGLALAVERAQVLADGGCIDFRLLVGGIIEASCRFLFEGNVCVVLYNGSGLDVGTKSCSIDSRPCP